MHAIIGFMVVNCMVMVYGKVWLRIVSLCKLQLVAASPYMVAPTSAHDGLDTLQLALVVFFLPSINAKTSLTLAVGTTCNLYRWCFSCTHYHIY